MRCDNVELPVGARCEGQEGEDLLWVEDVLVVAEVERGLHGGVDEALVELALAKHQEVVRFGAAPRVVHQAGLTWKTRERLRESRLAKSQQGSRFRYGQICVQGLLRLHSWTRLGTLDTQDTA